MYINDLGLGRATLIDSRNRAISAKNADSYAAVMQKALDNQKTAVTPTFATAGDIIIQEAFKKMESDPEWEETVMGKVKEYYAGDYAVGSAQYSYLNLTGQSNLSNYLLRGLIGGQNGMGLGVTGYSPYGISSLAASAYGNVLNSTVNSSLFGNWQL